MNCWHASEVSAPRRAASRSLGRPHLETPSIRRSPVPVVLPANRCSTTSRPARPDLLKRSLASSGRPGATPHSYFRQLLDGPRVWIRGRLSSTASLNACPYLLARFTRRARPPAAYRVNCCARVTTAPSRLPGARRCSRRIRRPVPACRPRPRPPRGRLCCRTMSPDHFAQALAVYEPAPPLVARPPARHRARGHLVRPRPPLPTESIAAHRPAPASGRPSQLPNGAAVVGHLLGHPAGQLQSPSTRTRMPLAACPARRVAHPESGSSTLGQAARCDLAQPRRADPVAVLDDRASATSSLTPGQVETAIRPWNVSLWRPGQVGSTSVSRPSAPLSNSTLPRRVLGDRRGGRNAGYRSRSLLQGRTGAARRPPRSRRPRREPRADCRNGLDSPATRGRPV